MAREKVKQVQVFSLPTEYERQTAEARRREMMAEMLAQQAYDPGQYQGAPIPKAAPVVKALEGYLRGREMRKAREAGEKAEAEASRAGQDIVGRLMGGGRMPKTAAELTEVVPAGRIRPPSETDLTEVTPEGAYTKPYTQDPAEAFRIAMTPAGSAAMRGNPALAAALQKSMEEKAPKSPYGSIDPGKFTSASLQRFDASVRAGSPDYTLLQSREYSELTPQQMAQLSLDVGKYGIESGRYQYETGQPAPTLPRFPFQSQSAAASAPAAARPSATPTATTPAGVAPIAAAPTTRRDTVAEGTTGKKQPSAFEVATPKQRQALQQEFPKARQAAQVGLAKLDQLDDYLSDLEQHKGTENITGLFGQIPIDIAPESRSARSVLEGFQQGASIQAINEARQASETGGAYGTMTVQEWPRLEGVFGAVVAAKDPEAFDIAIKNARKQIAAARGRYESSWNATYGDMDIGYKRSKYTPESRQYPRNKPKSDVRSRADAILRGE